MLPKTVPCSGSVSPGAHGHTQVPSSAGEVLQPPKGQLQGHVKNQRVQLKARVGKQQVHGCGRVCVLREGRAESTQMVASGD